MDESSKTIIMFYAHPHTFNII